MPDDICKLKLETIAPGGEALGRIDGKPVFIEGGAPDETVLCRVTEDHKTWARAQLLEIIEASAARVRAACPYYGKCGGCNLQHIDYNTQLAVKIDILRDAFFRIGGFAEIPEIEVFFSPQWEYRNRMQFHCIRENAKGGGQSFGLKGRRSGQIIEVSDCPVAEKGIRELLQSSAPANKYTKNIHTLTLPPEKDRFNVFARDNLLLSEGGIERGKINLLEKEIMLDAGVFFQSNIVMLEKLIMELQKTAREADHSLPMADLYCGAGTFSIFLSGMFPKLILAEENKTAVSLARENLKGAFGGGNLDKNAEFFALRDTEWEKTLLRRKTGGQKANFGFAVIDPPRTGLAPKPAAALAQDGPPLLAYVSCDSASLARDSKLLAGTDCGKSGGYKLKSIKMFDFYPQTAHIETLAVFEKK